MAKTSAKSGIILVKGYDLSTYGMNYEISDTVDPVEVTGFGDGTHNFIPGQRIAKMTVNALWDTAANKVKDALQALGSGHVTIIPEGYTLGNPSLSMPYTQINYNPSGGPATAISVGTVEFDSYGNNDGIERGYILQHGTITATTTGTGFDDLSGAAVTAACSGTIHVWTPTSTDTYVVKIQHSTTLGSGYTDLVTFTVTGTSRTSERVAVASGTVNRYRRVLATRTGAAGDTFGFSVHFSHT